MSHPVTPHLVDDALRRIAWIDAAKGYGIILVVLAHVARGLARSGIMAASPATQLVDRWIYSFHMPLFFFVSGLLLAKSAENNFEGFAAQKLRTIAYPYLVWSSVTVIIKFFMGAAVNQPLQLMDLPRILVKPVDQFWFLYALLLCALAAGFLLRVGLKPHLIALLALVLFSPAGSSGWIPLNDLQHYAVFFALGLAAQVSIRSFSQLRPFTGLGVSFIGFSLVTLFVIEPMFWNSRLAVLAIGLAGTASVMALAVASTKLRFSAGFEYLGRYSLEIYVAHTIASAGTRIFLQKITHVGDPNIHLLAGVSAGLACPIVLAIALRHAGITLAFALPRKGRNLEPRLTSI